MNANPLRFSVLFLFFAGCCIEGDAQTQPLWQPLGDRAVFSSQKTRPILGKNLRLFRLDVPAFAAQLRGVSLSKKRRLQTKNNPVFSFPNTRGDLIPYRLEETSVLSPSLQQKFPAIKSYKGLATDGSKQQIYLSISPLGMHAMVLSEAGEALYLDPLTADAEIHALSRKKELSPKKKQFCKVRQNTEKTVQDSALALDVANSFQTDGKLRTFRLALLCTGEYAQFHLREQNLSSTASDAEKKAVVLAAMHATLTRVNAIFERDVALNLQLIDNNEALIFLDPNTDGLSNEAPLQLLKESRQICNSVVGVSNFDIGHVFCLGDSGVAELASVCGDRKAQGVSGSTAPRGDAFDVDFVAHELGHQFGATHTFGNSCDNNRTAATAVEPGSGSTIMAYAGICPPNIQSNSDAYFHGVSIAQMVAQITQGSGDCGNETTVGAPPTVYAGLNQSIPVSTPFVLEGSATSSQSGLTYCWEQRDTEAAIMPPLSTNTGGPLFRSLPPSTVPQRHFPNVERLLGLSTDSIWNPLPSVGRTLNFMLTVRDNAVAGGQVASATRTLTVDGASGPFDVVSQSTSQLLIAGQRLRVLWEVANTDQPPVNTAEVDLLLSMDGGFTFPVILASQVPNDGVHEIIVPKQITSEGRIKVAAVGNVFYSINAANLTIKEEIEIPKGFTPNGDGQNDAWALKNTDIGTEETAFFPRASVRIHNRAGQVVYAASWYRNDWQGETLQGVKIPIGTYVFEVFSESGEFATKRGWLYVKY